MRVLLTKENKKNKLICSLETEGGYLHIKEGKSGKQLSSQTRFCGTDSEAIEELNEMLELYLSKGYVQNTQRDFTDSTSILDKAKWHYEADDYPKQLSIDSAYTHTAFFIKWLIQNNLVSDELKQNNALQLEQVKRGEISATEFYKNQLDGVFLLEDVKEGARDFVQEYFDFEKGQYLKDYETLLASNLPTLYHVTPSEQNYAVMASKITERLK
jgi:hypothetical protein